VEKTDNIAQRGLVGQTIILARLVELGKEVLILWDDHRRYDLAFYEGEEGASPVGRLVRVQCKVGWLYDSGAGVKFSTYERFGKTRQTACSERISWRNRVFCCILSRS
jgi:hypothetical protein